MFSESALVVSSVCSTLAVVGTAWVAYITRHKIRSIFGGKHSAPTGALAEALETINVYVARVKSQDEQYALMETKLTHLASIIESQSKQIALLKELVTSRADVAALINHIDQFHGHVVTRLDLIDNSLKLNPAVAADAAVAAAAVLQQATDNAASVLKKATESAAILKEASG